jgi:ABC-2 type transport system permease protein
MSKIGIIIKREYLSRVRNKTFLISTIVSPLVIFALIAFVGFISVKNIRENKAKLLVYSTDSYYNNATPKIGDIEIVDGNTTMPQIDVKAIDKAGYDGYIQIIKTADKSRDSVSIKLFKSLGVYTESIITETYNKLVRRKNFANNNVNLKLTDSILNLPNTVAVTQISKTGVEKEDSSKVAYGIGYGSAFLMYILVLLFGVQVMRGVSEEKTNRIAEVMVSSVQPLELMLGKIMGIGLVGLTGFAIWIGIILLIQFALLPLFGAGAMQASAGQSLGALTGLSKIFTSVNWPVILGCFLFYFLGGYFLYASMYAAIGSAAGEDASEAQQLSFPVTMPIIISIIIMMNAITAPSSSLATWASIIPFTSPIVMMARLPFGVPEVVPYWQLALSMITLIISILIMTWLAGRIYRTGILMYGKKASWKDLFTWLKRG